jgi:hypothetical protein
MNILTIFPIHQLSGTPNRNGAMSKIEEIQRFLNKIEYSQNGCWLWRAAIRGECGYGAFKYDGKVRSAHRVAYRIFKGDIPDNMCVCHTCDNKICVNPNHLFLGTKRDNAIDAYNKGRMKAPEGGRFQNGHRAINASLNNKTVSLIRMDLENGISQQAIASKYNIKRHIVADISCGRTYTNVQ